MHVRSRGMAVAALLSLICALGAVGCYLRSRDLRAQGDWLLVRGKAQAAEYVRSFDGKVQDEQIATLDRRERVLDRAESWRLGQLLLVLSSVLAAFASYVLYLFRRLREQLVQGLPEEPAEPVIDLASRRRIS